MRITGWTSDLRHAVRTLAKAPTTVAITVVSLGIGIGAVTTVFTVVDGVLHPPAPGLRDADRLVTVYTSQEDGDLYGGTSYPDYESLLEAGIFDDATATRLKVRVMEDGGELEQLLVEVVADNYFSVTGIRPVLGRAFVPGGGEDGSDLAVLGYDFWSDRFGRDPGVLGRVLRVEGRSVTVIGVAPEGLASRRFPVRPDLWMPLPADPSARLARDMDERTAREFLVLGRMPDGVSPGDVQARLDVLGARLARDHRDAWIDAGGRTRALTAVPEHDSRLNPGAGRVLRGVALFFFVVGGLVLLIAATNVTSLFLVRATRRQREIGLRLALGAARGRVIRLLLAEGLILGVAAGVLGLVFSSYLGSALASFSLPINVPVRLDFQPGTRAYLFAGLAALATSLVFSLVPALRVSRVDLVSAIGSSGASTARSRWLLSPRDLLVGIQCAASLVLLAAGALFLRSLSSASSLDLGLDPAGVAVVSKEVPESVDTEGIPAYYRALLDGLEGVPGATHVALSSGLELTLMQMNSPVSLRAPDGAAGSELAAFRNAVTEDYLQMLDIAVVRGRPIDGRDVPGAVPVAVVNETLARTFWPDEDPIGRVLHLTAAAPGSPAREDVTLQVVGVAEDGSYVDVGDPPTPYLWTSLYQEPARRVTVSLKGLPVQSMVEALRERVEMAPGEIPVLPVSSYESQLSIQFMHLRLASKMLGWGGGFGLLLALIGLYGLVAFSVAERTREIAVRRAVGAGPIQVVRGVVRRGLGIAVAGLVVGLIVLVPAARLLSSVLVGVSPWDPMALAGTTLVLLVAAAVASYVPARRAARIDPMEALRQE